MSDEQEKSEESQFIKMCDMFETKLANQYKENREEIRNIKKFFKKEIKSVNKKSKKNLSKKNTATGFNKSEQIPDKLAEFINVSKGTCMTRTAVVKLIFTEFTKKQLVLKTDKRVFRVDNEITKLFNLSADAVELINKSINPKDKSGLNIYNIQKYVAECYKS